LVALAASSNFLESNSDRKQSKASNEEKQSKASNEAKQLNRDCSSFQQGVKQASKE
jgi:hypothetical protein